LMASCVWNIRTKNCLKLLILIECLHDPANVQQTDSKRPALARVFWIHLLEVCWTFAGSCKHSISYEQYHKGPCTLLSFYANFVFLRLTVMSASR